jgi:hypothetical protein
MPPRTIARIEIPAWGLIQLAPKTCSEYLFSINPALSAMVDGELAAVGCRYKTFVLCHHYLMSEISLYFDLIVVKTIERTRFFAQVGCSLMFTLQGGKPTRFSGGRNAPLERL